MRSSSVRVAVVAVVLAGVVLGAPRATRANPVFAREYFEACKAERRRQIAEAMKIVDINERGRRLVDIVICERDDATAPRVAEPPPPFRSHAVLAAWAGMSWQVAANGYVPRSIAGAGELELGVRWRRGLSFALYGGASEYGGVTSFERLLSLYPPHSMLVTYAYAAQVCDVGLRLRLRVDRLWFALGLGVRDDHASAKGDLAFDDPEILALFSGQIGVSLLAFDGLTVDAVAAVAFVPDFGNATDQTVGLGVRLAARL